MRIAIFFFWILSFAVAGATCWLFFNPTARELRSARAVGRDYKEARLKVYSTIAAIRYCDFRAEGTGHGKAELLRTLADELGRMEESLGRMSRRVQAEGINIKNMGIRLHTSRGKWAALREVESSKNPSFVALAVSRERRLSTTENFAAVSQYRMVEMKGKIDGEIAAIKASREKINTYLKGRSRVQTARIQESTLPERALKTTAVMKAATAVSKQNTVGIKFRPGKINLRSAPGLSRQYLIGVISATGREKIELIVKKGAWYRVRLTKSTTAYVWGGNIADAAVVEIKKGGNRGWFYSSSGRRKVKCLTPSERYVLLADAGTWYKVYDARYGVGYIYKRYAHKA